MIRINYAHICNYALVDAGGNVYIMGIFENINTKKLPAVLPVMTTIISANIKEADESDTPLIVSIKDPNGKEVRKQETKLILGQEKQTALSMFLQPTFEIAGKYTIEISAGGKIEKELEIEVKEKNDK